MPERGASVPRLRVAALIACAAALLGPGVAIAGQSATTAAKTKPGPTAKKKVRRPPPAPVALGGWLDTQTAFPNRSFVLTGGPRTGLTPAGLRVTENGTPVTAFALTSMSDAQPGDLGTMLAVDQSMSPDGLSAAASAMRAFAAQRTAAQQLGVVDFDSSPAMLLPLTSDPNQINPVLSNAPAAGTGSDTSAALQMAVAELARAKPALGTVVLLSDGASAGAGGGAISPALRSELATTHAGVVTVGVKDRAATAASLGALSKAVPGVFVTSTPSRLAATLTSISKGLSRAYVLRYRSDAAAGHRVAVSVTAAGVPGGVQAQYATPAPVVASAPAAPVAPRRAHHLRPSFANTTLLSPWPSFGHPSSLGSAPAPAPSQSFWASSAAVPAVSVACALLIALALGLVVYRPSSRGVRVRVESFLTAAENGDDEPANGLGTDRGHARGSVLTRGSWWPAFVEAVEIGRGRLTPNELVKRAAIGGVLCGVLLALVSGTPALFLLPILAAPFVLRSVVNRAAEKQRTAFRDGLPSYMQDMASSIRVGRSFVGALTSIAEGAEEPTRSEFERAATDEALGRPLEESLEAVSHRMESSDMDQIALIAGLNRRSGSNVAEALDRVAEGARDRADLRREMKALTAQAKLSSIVLSGLPGLLLLGLSVISPEYSHPLFHTTAGIVALVIGAIMVFAGWKVMQRITNVDGV